MMDTFFSSDVPQFFLDPKLLSVPGKQVYGNSESIRSWINTIESTNNLDDTDDASVFEFVSHPFRIYCPTSPFSDKFESEGDILFTLDASAWAPEVFTPESYYDDSDESLSESSLSDNAQYITIPSDSPWFRPPSPSPGPFSAHELSTAAYASSCSSDVCQAIAQQELLLAIFYEELRRVLPSDDGTEYDSDWLEDVDADLLLAPLETYADLCWESAIREKSPVPSDRPLADVPTGFDEFQGTY